MRVLSIVVSALFALSLLTTGMTGTSFAADKKEAVKSGVKSIAQSASDSTSKSSEVATAKKSIKDAPKDIDINIADSETLQLIPGIGPKTADAIIAYRKVNGKFKSIDDLMSVKGIGEKSLAKMKPFLKRI